MKKLLMLTLCIMTFSSVLAMPSATRRRVNAHVSGGKTFTKDTYMIGKFSDDSPGVSIDYDGGPVLFAGLEYNSHNQLSFGLETGFLSIGYGDETVNMVPIGLNFWHDYSFFQGAAVLRLGMNLSYMHVLKHEFIDYGAAFGPQLSLCYELFDDVYIDGNVKYLYFGLNDERETYGSTLIPVTFGVILRL